MAYVTNVTNGDSFVSVTARRNEMDPSITVALKPDEAVEFAIKVLSAAQNVRDGIHGSDNPPKATIARAHQTLTWEPPVEVPGELITRLRKSMSQTEGDRKTVVAMILKAVEAGK